MLAHNPEPGADTGELAGSVLVGSPQEDIGYMLEKQRTGYHHPGSGLMLITTALVCCFLYLED